MGIRNSLQNKTPEERYVLKADAFAQRGNHTFSDSGYDVTVSDLKRDGIALSATVAVMKNGISVPMDNHIRIVNPPIMVPDGTFRTVVTEKGTTIKVPNYEENMEKSLQVVLMDIIKQQI